MRPIVAIVGRPNVGKSTLFNRLVGERRAIVQDTPGVTRDRNYADTHYDDIPYTLVDTGGFEPEAESGVLSQMRRQAMMAVEEADIVVFVVDAREGLVPADEEVADILRRSEKPLIVAVNKVDGPSQQSLTSDFYALGAETVMAVSAAHGRGMPALVEAIVELLPRGYVEPPSDPNVNRVALVGRPNVGKSTMTNRLLGEDRMIVDSRAGTTRDAVDSALTRGGRQYVLVDTAGLRRSRGIDRESTEGLSVIRTLRAVERCNVAVLLLDATEGVTDQDARIAGHIEDKGRGLVIVVNKWDAVAKDEKTAKAFAEQIELKMPFVHFAPILYVSGLTGLRVPRLLEQVDRVRAAQLQRITTGPLNRWLEECQRRHSPPVMGVRRVRLYYAAQVAIEPPTIMISCNHPDNVHFSYKRYLINQFREAFDVPGTPVRIVFRARGESSGRGGEGHEDEAEAEDLVESGEADAAGASAELDEGAVADDDELDEESEDGESSGDDADKDTPEDDA
jgi:GTP-binding protein